LRVFAWLHNLRRLVAGGNVTSIDGPI